MAHQLSTRQDGMVEFAFTGDRGEIWHGLGQEVPDGAPIADWKKFAGMDWQIEAAPIQYKVDDEFREYPGKVVLHRSDTKAPLGTVSNKFKVIQPGEVLDFFNDLIVTNGLKLSSAGVLFDGRHFFANAELGKTVTLSNGDEVNGYLLLTTGADGTLATTAKMVSTRVVCNNTLTIALNETGKRTVRQTHQVSFNPDQIKIDLGFVDYGWENFVTGIKNMTERTMTDMEVLGLFQAQFFNESSEEQTAKAERTVDRLMELYKGEGKGSDLAYGNVWGALNAVTELYTHGTGRRSASSQFWTSTYGDGDKFKREFHDRCLALI